VQGLVPLLSILILAAPTSAEEPSPAAEAASPGVQIEALLEVSGLDDSLDSMQGSIGLQAAAQLGSQGPPVTPQEAAELARVYAAAFDAERIRAHIRAALLEDFETTRTQQLIGWYLSPAGRKLRAAATELAGPEGPEKLGHWALGLKAAPPAPERWELVRRLDRATGATDQFTALVGTLSVAMARGLTAAMPSTQQAETSDADISEALGTVREQLRPLMQQQALLILLYSTRALSDAELLAYVEESESPASVWFNQASFRGLERGFAEASRELGRALGEWLPSRLDSATIAARRDEGNGFGTGRVDRDCVSAALERDAACADFACHFEASSFMEGCLEAATPTDSLCVDVPELGQVGLTVQWRVRGCARLERTDNFCRHLLSRVQDHCHTKPGETGA